MKTAPVTTKAITARINRKLKPDFKMLRKTRGRMMQSNFGQFHVIDRRRNRILDAIGRRGEIRDEADAILAKIRTDFTAFVKDGRIELTRTQLTSRFAPNPGRNGAMTPGRLYAEIIPDLITRQFAREIPKAGKLHVYQFMAGD